MTDHDAIAARVRQDRKAGTPGPWKCGNNNPTRVTREGRYIANFDPMHSNAPKCEIDARRAAHMPDLEAAYLNLYDEVKRLRAALTIYAQSGNWRLGGCCDPNSPNFTGEAIARAALKGDSDV